MVGWARTLEVPSPRGFPLGLLFLPAGVSRSEQASPGLGWERLFLLAEVFHSERASPGFEQELLSRVSRSSRGFPLGFLSRRAVVFRLAGVSPGLRWDLPLVLPGNIPPASGAQRKNLSRLTTRMPGFDWHHKCSVRLLLPHLRHSAARRPAFPSAYFHLLKAPVFLCLCRHTA